MAGMDISLFIVGLIGAGGIGALCTEIIRAWSGRKEHAANAADKIVEAADGVVAMLRAEVARAVARADCADGRAIEALKQSSENKGLLHTCEEGRHEDRILMAHQSGEIAALTERVAVLSAQVAALPKRSADSKNSSRSPVDS